MKLSLAIAARNEGPDLEATILTALAGIRAPDEIVVYDDASLEPLRPRVSRWARVITGKAAAGSGPAKHRAIEACTGKAIIIADSHCRFPTDAIEILVRELEFSPRAILCPASTDTLSDRSFRGTGASLRFEGGFWQPRWMDPPIAAPDPIRVPCALGGCYAFTRQTLDRVAGYAPGLVGYGIEEEYLSIRNWLTGGEVRVCPEARVDHRYNRSINRKTRCGAPENTWEMAANRHVAARVCFGHRLYRDFYKPHLPWNKDVQALLAPREEEIRRLAALIESRTTLTTDRLARHTGVRH